MSYVQQACDSITGFKQRYEKYSRVLTVKQYATGTITGYTSKIAMISLCYKKLPELLSVDEIHLYLSVLLKRVPLPAKSMFEHTVVGLRSYYKELGFAQKQFELPPVRRDKKLPVVLSESEVKLLLKGTQELREKAILSMLYSCGLRAGELCSLELTDIDSSRMTVHVRQSKNRKDRYVPLAGKELPVIRAYFKQYRPLKYLFNGMIPGSPMLQREASEILKKNCLLSGIPKRITCHSLRHTYATHLLEMGENIVRIKELLGHSELKATFIYLHIARLDSSHAFSPLDVLFKDPQG
jgi:site-specific recombinase XerD